MAEYTVVIPAEHEAGLSAARDEHNTELVLEEGQAVEDHPQYITDNQMYVQFVMGVAAESYAKHYT